MEIEFKDKIKNRRAELNMTLEDVAREVGVSSATVQRWESGNIKNLRRDKILALANALKTTPSYLMGWTDCANFQPRDDMVEKFKEKEAYALKLEFKVRALEENIRRIEDAAWDVTQKLSNLVHEPIPSDVAPDDFNAVAKATADLMVKASIIMASSDEHTKKMLEKEIEKLSSSFDRVLKQIATEENNQKHE